MNTNNRVPPPPRRCRTKATGQRRHRLCPGAAAGSPAGPSADAGGKGNLPGDAPRVRLPRAPSPRAAAEFCWPKASRRGPLSPAPAPPAAGCRQVSRRAGEGRDGKGRDGTEGKGGEGRADEGSGRGGTCSGRGKINSGLGGGTRLPSLPGGVGVAQECTRAGCWAEVSFVFDL